MAADRNYQCIADSLQAYNSSIYYNLSSADIDAMITIPEMMGHIDAIEAEKRCNEKQSEETQYQCVADSLQAYNSSIYCNLTRSDVEAMLTIPEMFGHIDAVNAAKRCGLKY
jgi:5-enolpyruvylshikimate-3-phosphate synthase